jgi:hypothetical protein
MPMISRARAISMALLGCALVLMSFPDGEAVGQREPEDPIVANVDTSIRGRLENIAHYRVTEHYAVYRNGGAKPVAEKTVRAEYQKSSGIHYALASESGSPMFQSRAIEPSLDSDRQANDPEMRDKLALTSDNYEFRVEPGNASLAGRDCLIIDVKARRKSIYLLNGKAWLDAKTLSLVRLEGVQSLKLSFWTGLPLITRDYENVSGFPMVIREHIEAHSYLFGQTTVEIDYQDYEVLRKLK